MTYGPGKVIAIRIRDLACSRKRQRPAAGLSNRPASYLIAIFTAIMKLTPASPAGIILMVN
jgi:hypothetical protein